MKSKEFSKILLVEDLIRLSSRIIKSFRTTPKLTMNRYKLLFFWTFLKGAKSAPITIHPGRDSSAPKEILRILLEAGGKKDKIVMGHLDRTIHKKDELVEFADEFG